MLGFHSIRADMSRRARCGIPQQLISFQPCALGAKRLRWLPASAWVRRHFSQRVPCPLVNTSGLCQNNDNARRLPTGPAVNMPPWLRHTQRVVSVCGPDIIANTGLSSTSAQSTAAHQFCLTCLTSLTSPTNAPHRTLMQNQTTIQYWGAGPSVIPLAASDYRTIRPFSSTGGKKRTSQTSASRNVGTDRERF